MQSIIEKTATFLSKQNNQMEIVLKTKQSGNPQFGFLNYNHYLNPYYKFIKGKIKDGVYSPKPEESKEEAKGDTDDSFFPFIFELDLLIMTYFFYVHKCNRPA